MAETHSFEYFALKTTAFTGPQKAYCMLEFMKSECILTIQRQFRTRYEFQPPTNKAIHAWFRKFEESGWLCDGKRINRPGLSVERVICVTSVRSSRKVSSSSE